MKKRINKRGMCAILASTLLIGTVLGHFVYNSHNLSANSNSKVLERLQAVRNKTEATKDTNSSGKLSKSARFIVELKDDAVADMADVSEYTSKLKSKEEKVIENQASIVEQVEKITGNKVISQTGYLVNSFSIDATRGQIKKILKVEGVEEVYEAAIYEPCMETALNLGNATAQLESEDYGYTGEGIVISIIDTGVNYNHKDMVLDEGVKTKFTKEEWDKKIELLGHGKYMTDKVPYGHNYITGKDDCLDESNTHGYHVSAIAAANGEIDGVAKNAQIIGMKVFDEGGAITSDGLVCAIEDSVKLGADVINMSLGSPAGFVTDEDYVQNAVNNASKEGVICCISAGNDGLSSSENKSTNILGIKDTSIVSSPGTALTALTVASADNKVHEYGHRTDNVRMSSFSSWGPSNELNIKPEITAPGGNIKAACSGVDGYETLSGTSMSSPYVAGAEAIILNAIKSKKIDLDGASLVSFMKNSIINTADVLYDPDRYIPYSVRNQGAGLVDVYGAVNNNVLATYNGEAKVELGALIESKTIDIVLTNYGKDDAVYNLEKSQIYKDYTKGQNDDFEYGIKMALDAFVTYNMSQVTVPAGGEVTVQATVNIPESFEKNCFVEAFISFKGENVENIGLPVLGFYGNWEKEPIIDKPVYEEGDSVINRLKAIHNFEYGTALCSGNNSELLGVVWQKVMDKDNTDVKIIESTTPADLKIAKKAGLVGGDTENITPIIEENTQLNLLSEEFEPTRAKVFVKEDGYYTFEFSVKDDADVSIVEYFIEEGSLKGKNVLLETTTKGSLSKELKLSKDAVYLISVEAQCMAPNKALASVKYYASYGANCYKLKRVYKGDAVAFSPNGDDVRDTVKPKVLQLRNAKEMKVKVFDKDKTLIRTIATLTDVSKTSYSSENVIYGSDNFSDYLVNPGNAEYIGWDGKVYNKTTGEYEYAEDGQYYIQIESKITKNSDYQVVTMPVKIDRVKPTIDTFEFRKVKDNYELEFIAKDDVMMNSNYYVDVEYTKGSANNVEYDTYNEKFVETSSTLEGNYIIDLSKYNSYNIKKVTVMVEDMAGNQTTKEYKTSDNQSDLQSYDNKIIGMGYVKLCGGVALDRMLKDGMSVELTNNTFAFEGECDKDIAIECKGGKVTYGSGSASIYEEGKKFRIEVAPSQNDSVVNLGLVISNKNVEIFSQSYNITVLRRKGCNIKFFKDDNVIDNKLFADEKTEIIYANKDNNGKVSFKIEVESKEEDFSKYNVDMFYLLECFAYSSEIGPISSNVTYEGNNIYRIDLDEIQDVADVQLKCSYDSYFDGNLNVCVATNEEKFAEVKDGYEVKLVSGITNEVAIKKSMLNSDGTLTINGRLGTMPTYLTINDKLVDVEDETNQFSYKYPVAKGLNFIKIKAGINGKEVSLEKCLHYEEITFSWVDTIKEVDGVIDTDKDTFNLAGAIKSYSNVKTIVVCGEMMYSASDSIKTYEDKPFVKNFDYNINLVKGTNIIKIEVTTSSNEVVEKVFKVYYK